MARSTLLATGALVAALLSAILAGTEARNSHQTAAQRAYATVSVTRPTTLRGALRTHDGALAASTTSTTSRTSATASTTSAARTHSLAVGFTALATAAGLCVFSLMRRLRSHKRAG